MLPFQRILFPVDFSPNCEAVVPYVLDWVERFDASVKLVHACGLLNLPYDVVMSTSVSGPEDILRYQMARLAEFSARHFSGCSVELHIERGEAATVIRSVIARDGTDLVMMPTHGYGPIRKFLLGSTTANLLYDVATPLWTAPHKFLQAGAPKLPCRSIVCAVDESDEHEAVAVAGDYLARHLNAKLSLVRASFPLPGYPEIDASGFQRELVAASTEELGRVKNKHCANASSRVMVAPVIEAVRDEIRRTDAGLLIAGRGNSQDTFARAFSSLYPMIRDAGCPVLSI